MCRLRNIAIRDYHEIMTTGQKDGRTDDRQTPDKVILMCRYASQATQKVANRNESRTISVTLHTEACYKFSFRYVKSSENIF